MKWLRPILGICLVVLSTLGILALNEFRLLIHEMRSESSAVSASLSDTLKTANEATRQAQQAAAKANLAADTEVQTWQNTSREIYKSSAAVQLLVVRTDRTLNDLIAPKLIEAVQHATNASDQVAANVNLTLTELQPTLANLSIASGAAAKSMADPHIAETLVHLDDTTGSLALTAKQVNLTASHIEDTANLIDQRAHQVLRPASLTYRIAKELFGFTAQAAQISAGFLK